MATDDVLRGRGPSRRTVLLGAAGAVAGALGLSSCAGSDPAPTTTTPGATSRRSATPAPTTPPMSAYGEAHVEEGGFSSLFMPGVTGWAVATPDGVARQDMLPVLLYLHGLGGDHLAPFDYLQLHVALQQWAAHGGRPFAIATADGGDGWWKPQPDGTDASRMLMQEFVPMLWARGYDTRHLVLGGASMGGYGALRLAPRLRPHARGVGVIAPALGEPAGRSGSLADVRRHPERLRGVPVLLRVGREDALREPDLAYADALRSAGVQVDAGTIPGDHLPEDMAAAGPDLMRFAGRLFGRPDATADVQPAPRDI